MRFGVIIIGDEILSGKRRDGHLARSIEQLAERGLALSFAHYIGDDCPTIAAELARTMATDDVVFCFGGIGATPDDHTRQAAANAAGQPLERHPEGLALLRERFSDSQLTENRMRMVDFPRGARLIPNPYNRIPGFALGRHYFLPGFPEMAWPMQVWILETYFRDLFHAIPIAEQSLIIEGAGESDLIDLMEALVRDYPGARLSSLPRFESAAKNGRLIELSLKGDPREVAAGMATARATITRLGFPLRERG
jgi:molybdopterin-biosynthesis enzyme MoeA-like protein